LHLLKSTTGDAPAALRNDTDRENGTALHVAVIHHRIPSRRDQDLLLSVFHGIAETAAFKTPKAAVGHLNLTPVTPKNG
jgi:hypothetical protein